ESGNPGAENSAKELGPRFRAKACTHVRECWSAVGQSGATAFPPPLWGRDRERGTTSTASVLHRKPRLLGSVRGSKLYALCFVAAPLPGPPAQGGREPCGAHLRNSRSVPAAHFRRCVHALALPRGRRN